MQNIFRQQDRVGEHRTVVIEDDEFLEIASMNSEVGALHSMVEKFFPF